MTANVWHMSNNPQAMLSCLPAGVASDRQMRLFAVACCRCIWHLLTDEQSRQAVEVAERFADGRASTTERAAARAAAWAAWAARATAWAARAAAWDAEAAAGAARAAAEAAAEAAVWAADAAAGAAGDAGRAAEAAAGDARAAQSDLLRDIFGDPFGPQPTIAVEVLAWNDRCVPRIAEAIYEERRFGDLPILADALLDAGADDDALLDHCRSPGPHVRGCWALDLARGGDSVIQFSVFSDSVFSVQFLDLNH